MSDKLTPCEEKGYKVGDKFRVVGNASCANKGDVLTLTKDDNSDSPFFSGSSLEHYKDCKEVCVFLTDVDKIGDEVASPSHYNNGEIECIVAIKASMTPLEFQGYLKGNAIKYLWRMGLKGKPLVDVQKAQWYIDKLASTLQESE